MNTKKKKKINNETDQMNGFSGNEKNISVTSVVRSEDQDAETLHLTNIIMDCET